MSAQSWLEILFFFALLAIGSLLSGDAACSPAKVRGSYRVIESETDRLTGLVSNLLDVSRLRAGVMPLVPQRTDLEQVLYSAVNSLSSAGSAVAINLPRRLLP